MPCVPKFLSVTESDIGRGIRGLKILNIPDWLLLAARTWNILVWAPSRKPTKRRCWFDRPNQRHLSRNLDFLGWGKVAKTTFCWSLDPRSLRLGHGIRNNISHHSLQWLLISWGPGFPTELFMGWWPDWWVSSRFEVLHRAQEGPLPGSHNSHEK